MPFTPTRSGAVTTALILGTLTAISAAAGTVSLNSAPNALVPDGTATPLANKITVAPTPGRVTDVNVSVNLAGDPYGWNGDLYLALSHNGRLSVLLNRTGRTSGDPLGFDDDGGFAVTFDDAATDDIHSYRSALTTPLGSGDPLTGTWQPDARSVDPDDVTTSSLRDSFLAVFNDASPSGDWVLQVADLSAGGTFRLLDWSLDLTFSEAMPDGGNVLAIGAGALVGLGWWQRRARRGLPARG